MAALADKNALVVGLGARGSLVAAHLAAAGVGQIGLVDGGSVATEDLQQGPLTFAPDVGSGKSEGLAAKLSLVNPEVHVEPFPAYVDADNAGLIVQGADVVIECTDDREAQQFVSDACTVAGIDLVCGMARPQQSFWFVATRGACARAIDVDDPPDPNDKSPSTSARSGLVASAQAAAAIDLLGGGLQIESGSVNPLDSTSLNWRRETVVCREDCSCRTGSVADNV